MIILTKDQYTQHREQSLQIQLQAITGKGVAYCDCNLNRGHFELMCQEWVATDSNLFFLF